jgi:hypothetical protein
VGLLLLSRSDVFSISKQKKSKHLINKAWASETFVIHVKQYSTLVLANIPSVSLAFFLCLKIIVTLEYQCSIYFYFSIVIPLIIKFHLT